jgi:hypothetical protein
MQLHSLLVDAATVADGAALECRTSPFDEGKNAVMLVHSAAFNGTVKLQSSDNGTTWADVETVTEAATDRGVAKSVTLKRYMRGSVTARTGGAVSMHLMG